MVERQAVLRPVLTDAGAMARQDLADVQPFSFAPWGRPAPDHAVPPVPEDVLRASLELGGILHLLTLGQQHSSVQQGDPRAAAGANAEAPGGK